MQNAEVRDLIAKVSGDLTKLTAGIADGTKTASTKDLDASWNALVAHLAIGPAPATRACPSCKTMIIRDATRCLNCWAQSAPPTA